MNGAGAEGQGEGKLKMYMSRQQLIIISGGVLLVLLIVSGIFLFGGKKDSGGFYAAHDTKRNNTLRLAASYAEAGEYDRALNLLDSLLIENHEDEDARILQMQILSIDRTSGTDSLIEAQRRFLEEQQRQNALLASSQAAFNQQRAASDFLAASETDAAAERRAAAQAEEVRRRAQEEELAKASRELQEIMRRVNNFVSDGKARLASGDLAGAAQLFSEAKSTIPP
ncbi:MAG: hypothetical protein LBI12_00825 [Treponema sp.]|jgi:hypothetical protein|nr:hypothetical protein [Treponema sp.]